MLSIDTTWAGFQGDVLMHVHFVQVCAPVAANGLETQAFGVEASGAALAVVRVPCMGLSASSLAIVPKSTISSRV